MTGYEKEIEYYFCEAKDNFTENYRKSQHIFFITPKEHFDDKGFLSDRGDAVYEEDLPEGFQRVSDSTFEYVGKEDPFEQLFMARKFTWRDMGKEIQYLYARRKILGLDDLL